MYFNVLGRTIRPKLISILTVLLIILIFLWFKKVGNSVHEGFTQEKPFILKEGDDIFDEFYAEIYDTIHQPSLYVDSVTKSIIKRVSIDVDKSLILVVASDTGEQSNSLHSEGFDVHTIFKYSDMFEMSEKKYPTLKARHDDIENPMTFDKSTFSTILCSGTILYTMENKKTFFRNIYNWLEPDGIFLLQLSDRSKFDTIITSRKEMNYESPQKYHSERITDSEIDFGSFKYLSRYNFIDADSKDIVLLSETFTDTQTNYIRKNEHTLYMENIENILKMTVDCGFSTLSKINLIQDDNKFIYILQRKH